MVRKRDLILIRDFVESDRNLIFKSWLKGLRFGNTLFKEIPPEIYFENYHRVIERLLLKPSTSIRVACLKETEDVVLGYSVFTSVSRETILHWVFVKEAWRKIGIAHDLIPSDVKTVTHLTYRVTNKKRELGLTFNPFLI